MYEHLNVVGEHPFIPLYAFTFVPKREPPKDDYCIGYGKKARRLIFEGWASDTYSYFEKEQLREFYAHLQRKQIVLDERWDNSWRLRFLQSTSFNIKDCVGDMNGFISYMNANKEPQMTPVVKKIMYDGLFYIGGRDCHYRPILVFDIKKILESKMTEPEFLEGQIYYFYFVLRNLLIPGQVYNWVAVIDCNNESLFSLFGALKYFMTFLSSTYRCRMFVAYVVHCPFSIRIGWSIAKKFLQEETINKMNFLDDKIIPDILLHCHPSQVYQKFGGTCPNFTTFWPPRYISSHYRIESHPVTLLTPEKYDYLYKTSQLRHTKTPVSLLKPLLNDIYDKVVYTYKLVVRLYTKKIYTQIYKLEEAYKHYSIYHPFVLHQQGKNLLQSRLKPIPVFNELFSFDYQK